MRAEPFSLRHSVVPRWVQRLNSARILPLRIAQQDDRPQAEPHGDVIVVLGDLALVAEIDPDRAEDVGHLGLEDRRIGVDQPMDAILLHELVPVVEVGGAFDPAAMPLSFSSMASVLHGRALRGGRCSA